VHAWLVERDYGHTSRMTQVGRCTHLRVMLDAEPVKGMSADIPPKIEAP
jgi:hypothetical protein